MKIPDAIEPSLGFRAWVVEEGFLMSLTRAEAWPRGKALTATCTHHEGDEVPHARCSCGIYAVKSYDKLFDTGYLRMADSIVGDGDVIAGEVYLWGGLVPGQYGWRAQHAYPKRLLIPYTYARLALPLKEAYGVPFKLWNTQRRHN